MRLILCVLRTIKYSLALYFFFNVFSLGSWRPVTLGGWHPGLLSAPHVKKKKRKRTVSYVRVNFLLFSTPLEPCTDLCNHFKKSNSICNSGTECLLTQPNCGPSIFVASAISEANFFLLMSITETTLCQRTFCVLSQEELHFFSRTVIESCP